MVIPWDSKTGEWSSCLRLDANFTAEYFNQSIPAPPNKTVKCDKWVYDDSVYQSTAVTEVRARLRQLFNILFSMSNTF